MSVSAKTEKRRLNADFYGLISTDREGYQVVSNLLRGTVVTFGRVGFLSAWIEAMGREFKVDKATLQRLRDASVKVD